MAALPKPRARDQSSNLSKLMLAGREEGEGREVAGSLTEEQAQLKKAEALAEKGQAIAQRTGQWLKKRLSDRNLDRGERAELESIGRRFEAAGRRFEEVSRKVRERRRRRREEEDADADATVGRL